MQHYINSRVEKKVRLWNRLGSADPVQTVNSNSKLVPEKRLITEGCASLKKKTSQGKCSKEIIKYSEFFKIWQSMIIQDFCIQGKGFWTKWQICYGQSHWSEDEAKPFPFCVCHEVSYCITLIKPCYKISQVHLSKPVISLSATLINLAQLPACCLVHP